MLSRLRARASTTPVLAEREARVRALIRRSHGRDRNVLVHGALALDSAVRSASADGEMLDRSAPEMAVLELLRMGCGRVVAVWLAVSLLCLMLATFSISEYLVASAIDAPCDEKLSDFLRMLAGQVRAGHKGVVIGTNAIGLVRRTVRRRHSARVPADAGSRLR